MKLIFLFVLLFALLPTPVVAASPRVCQPASSTAIIAWLPGVADGIPQAGNEALFKALYALDGPRFGYTRGDYVGMDIPADWQVEARFNILPAGQWIWFMASKSEPDKRWAYWFPNDPVFTVSRPSGDYYGIHPCRDAVISPEAVTAIYQLIQW